MSLFDNIREAEILIHILIKHANLLFPEKWLSLPDGENMMSATSTSQRTESS